MHTQFWSEILKEGDPSSRTSLTQLDTIKNASSMVNSADGIQCCSYTEGGGVICGEFIGQPKPY
jgi:hypothetical protein